jgi:GNAT superfamily N-acetyltransferase
VKPVITIERIYELPGPQIARLIVQSEAEGFRFLVRLRDEWYSGVNRFSGAGEALFGAFDGDQLIAIGGITRSSSQAGRLRRCYVDKGFRRRGVGRALVASILEYASSYHGRVQLLTDTSSGDAFYRTIGFTHVCSIPDVSHEIYLHRA